MQLITYKYTVDILVAEEKVSPTDLLLVAVKENTPIGYKIHLSLNTTHTITPEGTDIVGENNYICSVSPVNESYARALEPIGDFPEDSTEQIAWLYKKSKATDKNLANTIKELHTSKLLNETLVDWASKPCLYSFLELTFKTECRISFKIPLIEVLNLRSYSSYRWLMDTQSTCHSQIF